MISSKLTIHPKEEELKNYWEKRVKPNSTNIPVNQVHYSFDTAEREKLFLEKQFRTDEEKERYRWYRSEWFRRAKEFDPGKFPLAVACELVSTCNLGCSMCYTITEEFQNSVVGAQRMLPWPVVKAVIDECAELGVPSILFSWRGESTLYRSVYNGKSYRFSDVLKYARERGILEITSLTHGQIINNEMAEAIVEAEPNWLSFSIDGLETAYNKIRTPKSKQGTDYNAFQEMIANIQRLVHLREAKKKDMPRIRVNTIYPAIAHDPEAYHTFMAGIGVDLVTVNELLDFRGEELPEEAIIDNWACQYPFQRLTISANGIVLPCTGAHNEESGLVLGRYKGSAAKVVRNVDGSVAQIDVPEIGLQDAWKSSKLEEIRRIHKEGKRKRIEPGCKYCRHGAIKHGVTWIPDEWDMDTMQWKGRVWRE